MNYIKVNINRISDTDINACLSLMSEERKKYLDTFKSMKRRRISIGAEWLAKQLIGKECGKSVEDITLLRTEKGKPYVEENYIYFSISHSQNFIAVCTDNLPIGIDIEEIRDIDLSITQKVCTKEDMQFLKNSENPVIAFYKIWTAKEAYFKKTGTGITKLKSVSYCDLSPVHYFEDGFIITIV